MKLLPIETKSKRILVLCAHLHEDRASKRDHEYLQPMAGLHVASLLDRRRHAVSLYHEMWSGPFHTASIRPGEYAIVFLTGLQMDFDRMRQLSFFFRRAGTLVVAGGSICTLFPEFSGRFFDVVCAGGVEAVAKFMQDYETGMTKPLYRSAQHEIMSYNLDHSLLNKAGVTPPAHYLESSRGCNFKCDFCSLPAERARHAVYALPDLERAIDNAIRTSPRFSIRRLYPMIWFIDNNFSNNLPHLRAVCRLLKNDKRIRLWGALVTQDVLRNRELIKLMADSKCRGLFTGIESLDPEFIAAHDKRQNASGASSLMDDIAYADSLGIIITYGYLFDPRMTEIAQMERELRAILNSDILHHPFFLAFVAPLAGTKLFWEAAEGGELLPNLRLRDLDGRVVAYRNTKDTAEALGEFARNIFTNPEVYMRHGMRLRSILRHLRRQGWRRPVSNYLFFENRMRLTRLGWKHSRTARTYMGGSDILDPQYRDYPSDISPAERELYFDPILVTDEHGALAPWLVPYRPLPSKRAA
jgi:radical SAM superfamily enzyme YgiQ (UPF0313 family)